MVPLVECMDQQANFLALFSSISLHILCASDKPDCVCSQYTIIFTLSFFCSCLSRTLFKCYLFIHATTNYLTPTMVLGAREIKMLFDISIWMSKGILNIAETVPLMFITQCDSPPLFLSQEMVLLTPLSHPGQNPKS